MPRLEEARKPKLRNKHLAQEIERLNKEVAATEGKVEKKTSKTK